MSNSPPGRAFDDSESKNPPQSGPSRSNMQPSHGSLDEWEEAERELTDSGGALGNLASDVPSSDRTDRRKGAGEPSANVHFTHPHSVDPTRPLMMVETAFLASTASLIWLVNFYFPMGPFLRVFFPVPIALIYLRWGNRAAWMGALVSGLLLSVLMGPPRSLLYIMPFGLMGVTLGILWHRKAAWGASIGAGALIGALGFFFRVWLVSLLLGDDLWQYATTQVTELIDWVCIRFGVLFQPDVLTIQAAIAALVVVNNIVYLFVVHLVAWFLFDRLQNPIPPPPKWVQVLMEYEE